MTADPAPVPSELSPESMHQAVRVAFGLWMMLLNLILVYLLIKIWPGKVPVDSTEQIAVFGTNSTFT